MSSQKKKVVIIGGGPAGVTAALELSRKSQDFDITLIEESGSIGGISRTVLHKNNRMDIGGHRFFSKDQKVVNWWKEILPTQGKPSMDDIILNREKPLVEGGPDPEQTDDVMLIRQRVSRIYYGGHFFDYPVSLSWKTIKTMGFLTTMKVGFSYLKSIVVKKEETNLENFYINRFGRVLYSMFFEGYTEKLWGRHPSQISADWGAQRVKGLSIVAVIKDMFSKLFGTKGDKVEVSLIEEFTYPKLGPGQLWETVVKLAEENGVTTKMNTKAVGLVNEKDKLTGVRVVENGEEKVLDVDYVFSSMPLNELVASLETPAPENVQDVAKALPFRDFVTVGLLVPELNLKNETNIPTLGNIVPDCWIYIQEPSLKLGRLQIFNNWSPYLVENPEKTVWIGLEYFCDEGDEFWNMEDEECIQFAIQELSEIGLIKEKEVITSHRERVKKAYPAYFDTYDQIDTVIDYLDENLPNLFCVGRNGQHRYNNMDHSMATSFEAIDNLLNGVTTKDNIWSVNTDKEFHETDKEAETEKA